MIGKKMQNNAMRTAQMYAVIPHARTWRRFCPFRF